MSEIPEISEPVGRIEVAPEVLTTIARYATLEVEGVSRMGNSPGEKRRGIHRLIGDEGVVLHVTDEDALVFDIYVLMEPHVNIVETSRKLQRAVIEAMDKMVGLSVDSVNIHVDDVIYGQGEAA